MSPPKKNGGKKATKKMPSKREIKPPKAQEYHVSLGTTVAIATAAVGVGFFQGRNWERMSTQKEILDCKTQIHSCDTQNTDQPIIEINNYNNFNSTEPESGNIAELTEEKDPS